jgi:glycosyltransferase involved in cell wall biosynthesis
MNNLFSIVTPSYNQSCFIERTIQSVLTQNFSSFEYIIMDGGSTDNTLEILKKYSPKLRWVSEQDEGQAQAVNKGIKATSGEIIGWLNSDDIYYPDTLKKVYDFFALHPEIDILYGDAYHIAADDQIIEPYYTEGWNIERLKEVCYLCQPAVFFRRRIIKQFGLLNEKLTYCMDYEYWLRLAIGGAHFTYFPELLAGSRLHPATKTLGARVKVHKEINDMLKNLFKKVPDRWLSNYAHALVESNQQNNRSPKRLQKDIAIQTLLASLYWNKWISKSLLRITTHWLGSHFKIQS